MYRPDMEARITVRIALKRVCSKPSEDNANHPSTTLVTCAASTFRKRSLPFM